ncbi:PAX3- and PAX7-binding protein 1 isoform X1 [Anopheles darlingi]|uniref:PAX3- and PAX7-binding protein 1 isoform X1 n=1 Tax=Anopheles darlingi TaxID=43151 RepID=UPI0021002DCF|nr:PAX3- and PAX7-binding protein 1 isoform X1 [Anopheles darlingi]
MSLFRKPKKPIQRRVFSGYDDEDEENAGGTVVSKDAAAAKHGNGNGTTSPQTEQPTTATAEPLSAVSQTATGGTTGPTERKRKEHRSSASAGGGGGGSGSATDRSDSKANSTKASASASSKANSLTTTATKHSLLSFDDEEEGEVFQVKKSSHSKKVMKSLDKERRRKRHLEKSNGTTTTTAGAATSTSSLSSSGPISSSSSAIHGTSALDGPGNGPRNRFSSSSPPSSSLSHDKGSNDKIKREKCDHSSSNIQTEIRTDDFVLVVKKSDPENLILNGRAALCAGRDDMSSEDEDTHDDESSGHQKEHQPHHRFSKPQDNFKMCLENGVIPDAAMIHAARKRRQKAREQGEFIPVEEPKEDKNKKRTVQEDGDGDGSDEDDDRIDMSAITGAKEREERREQFNAIQREDSDAEDSDIETKEWENQQIRKGVTGAQLVSAQQESIISQYLMQSSGRPTGSSGNGHFSQTFQNNSNRRGILNEHSASGDDEDGTLAGLRSLTTAELLEQAYATTSVGLAKRLGQSKQRSTGSAASMSSAPSKGGSNETKPTGPRMPQQILTQLTERHRATVELHQKHADDIEHITKEIKLLQMDHLSCEQRAPVAAAKYRFYQEFRCYVTDLVECLNEKVPLVAALEQRTLQLMGRHSAMLIERRRQDVRDQAKEMADACKTTAKRLPDDPERIRRAAEREGRRTRRRRDREKNETSDSHYDGMSSDDEIPDMEAARYRAALQSAELEARDIFSDAAEAYGEIEGILGKFEHWRDHDMPAYRDAYVSLCLPKIVGPLIRLQHITWNPLVPAGLDSNAAGGGGGATVSDFEHEEWFRAVALYGCRSDSPSEAELNDDPDVRLLPTIVEKIFLPKLTALCEQYWDPLSTTQTLRLVRLLKRLVRDYPSLRLTCKPLRALFQAILDKLKQSVDNDVFIPIFPKQAQEAKSSFFQRQFCSGLKLFRNITSWQGILADGALKELAIGSLLNRYLLNGMRVCTAPDAIGKASTIVYTLPRVWLAAGSPVVQSMDQFVTMLRHLESQLEPAAAINGELIEQIRKILSSLHVLSA